MTHQLIAALGAVIGLDAAYRAVQAVAVFAFPIAMGLFAREITGPRTAIVAAFLSNAVGGVYLVLYTFGQLPSFVAMVVALAACASLARFVRRGRRYDLASWAFLAATAITTHHHTVLVILPFLAAATVMTVWCQARYRTRETLPRVAIAAGLAGLAAVLAIVPFWWWYFSERLPQAPIPHPSRDNLFKSAVVAEMFFFGMYAGIGVLAPLAVVVTVKRRRLRPISISACLLGVLGLGTLTPLPSLAFQGWWDWLTYERFSLWAAVLLVIPAATGLQTLRRRPRVAGALVTTMIVLVGWQANFSNRNDVLPRPLQTWEEAEVVKFLTSDNHGDWSYLTLGLGEAQFARLSRLISNRAVDGTYYTGRIHQDIRESGIGTLDSAWWWPKGRRALAGVLQRPEEHSLKWAITTRRDFDPILRLAGWRPLHAIGSDHAYQPGDPVNSLIWIWQVSESRHVPELPDVVQPSRPRLFGFLWGTVPIASLLTALVALAYAERRNVAEGWSPAREATPAVGTMDDRAVAVDRA